MNEMHMEYRQCNTVQCKIDALNRIILWVEKEEQLGMIPKDRDANNVVVFAAVRLYSIYKDNGDIQMALRYRRIIIKREPYLQSKTDDEVEALLSSTAAGLKRRDARK